MIRQLMNLGNTITKIKGYNMINNLIKSLSFYLKMTHINAPS